MVKQQLKKFLQFVIKVKPKQFKYYINNSNQIIDSCSALKSII